ncbi:MAG: hypothetical protein IK140_07560 [Clostridia bacterium]|nr:hypothetical protein [Clostridia bacterium]
MSDIKVHSGSCEEQDIAANVAMLRQMELAEPSVKPAVREIPKPRVDGNSYLMIEDMEAEKARLLSNGGDSKATLKRRFMNAALIGDSIAEDAVHYQYLEASEVFADVGARASIDDPRLEKAVSMGKQVYVFTYGMNDMDVYGADVDTMIQRYTASIESLKQQIPDARVYVQAVFRPRDDKLALYPYYNMYNDRLLEMCDGLGIGFFDPAFIMEAYPEMYENDGLHISRKIYGVWLTFIADAAGL